MNLKPTFFSADWHIGHAKAIEYDKRPFRGLDHMHETLITRYNSTVPESGICYFLGDMGNKTEDMRKVINRLNGTKVLILGNHDKGISTMYNCGFDVVLYSASLYIGEHRVTMSHCPFVGVKREDTSHMKDPTENWHGEKRAKHLMSAMKDEGQFHLHGHIHSSKDRKEKSKTVLGRQMDVGCVAHNYTPISLSVVESWVMRTIGEEKSGRIL